MTFSLASLMTRYKPIDVNEFQQLATAYLQNQQGAANGTAGTGTPQAGVSVADPFISTDTSAAAASVQTQQQTSAPATDAVRGVTATTNRTAPVANTQTAATAAGAKSTVNIPSSAIAPRTDNDFWYAHIAQFKGQYLTDGPSMRPNCGPASVTMALRMIGLDIPGFNGQRSEAVLDKARILATGTNDTSVGTTDAELEKLITASGARWSESQNFSEITNWVKQGIPVVLSGNPAAGWDSRYSADQVYPFSGGHWVTVSGYDQKTGYYIVNDPLSQIGPLYVSETELSNYTNSHGKLGIAVFR